MEKFSANGVELIEFERQLKNLQDILDSAADIITNRIERGIRPQFTENIPLVSLEESFNVFKTYDARKEAMALNRLALTSLYDKHRVDETKTLARVKFHSGISSPRPATFMGASAISYVDKGQICLTIERYGEFGIGFVEDLVYSLHENPDATVISALGKTGIVTLGPPVTGTDFDVEPTVPYRFRLAMYRIEGNKMPLQFLD